MVTKIVQVKLLAIREGVYIVYVFQNLETLEYIMCTRVPNWQTPEVTIGDSGFLEYQIVKAGESYFDPIKETTVHYNYSNTYFINFIQKTELVENNQIIL